MGRLPVGRGQGPALQREVRTGAADDVAVAGIARALQPRVGAGQVVRPQLGERGVDIRLPLPGVEAVAVQVGRHHALAEVGRLLHLEDERVRAEGVDDATGNVDGVAGRDRVAGHGRVVILGLEGGAKVVLAEAGLDPGEDGGAGIGPEDVPGLGLAVGLAVHPPCRLVVGVEMDRQGVGGVEELVEDREMRAVPALADQLVGVFHHHIVEETPGEGAGGHGCPRVAVVAHLPGLGDDALWDAALTEALGDKSLAEGVGADVEGELEGGPLHRDGSSRRLGMPVTDGLSPVCAV